MGTIRSSFVKIAVPGNDHGEKKAGRRGLTKIRKEDRLNYEGSEGGSGRKTDPFWKKKKKGNGRMQKPELGGPAKKGENAGHGRAAPAKGKDVICRRQTF